MNSEPIGSTQARVGDLVFRSIGVPDAVTDEGRNRAAAHLLARVADLDISLHPNMSDATADRLRDAELVVEAALEALKTGALDEVIGDFGYQDNDWHARQLIRAADLNSYGSGLVCAKKLIECVKSYVARRPFEDSTGHPFS